MGDLLRGLDGNDIITGDGSTTDQSTGDDDKLIGGRGSDQLYGGGGNDDLNAMEDVYGQGSTNSAAGRLSSIGLEYDQSTYSSAAQALYSGGIATIESVDEKNYDVHGSTSAARDRKSRAAFDGGDYIFINVGARFIAPNLVALQQAA